MWSVERFKWFAVVMVEVLFMAAVASVPLVVLHAGPGWYYGVGLFLTTLGTIQVLLPGLTFPEHWSELPGEAERRSSQDDLPSQNDQLEG
jgi:hypothetical protein